LNPRVLIIDDDEIMGRLLKTALQRDGYAVTYLDEPSSALELVQEHRYDLLLLDLIVGQRTAEDALGLAEQMRAINPDLVIFIITGYASLETALRAIDLGIAAYLQKPFDMGDVLRRVREAIDSVRRRQNTRELAEQMLNMMSSGGPQTLELRSEGLYLNRGTLQATLNGRPLDLTITEFRVLWTLVAAHGRPCSASLLVKASLGYELGDAEAGSLIKSHISNLRLKLGENAQNPRLLFTLRGQGYMWKA